MIVTAQRGAAILCITGQAHRDKLHQDDFQTVDIASITRPVTKWSVMVMEAAEVPWAFRQAFQIMKSITGDSI
jgi:tartronate-semialdehyde synthase